MAAPANPIDPNVLLDDVLAVTDQYNHADRTAEEGPLKVVVDGNADSLAMSDIPKRDIAGLRKVYWLFDMHRALEFTQPADTIIETYVGDRTLPEAIQLAQELPPHARMSLIIGPAARGQADVQMYDVMKLLQFTGGAAAIYRWSSFILRFYYSAAKSHQYMMTFFHYYQVTLPLSWCTAALLCC